VPAAQIKIGDVWDALESNTVKHSGAGLGTVYFRAPFSFRVPNRGFADSRDPDPSLITDLNSHGINPVASGKYEELKKAKKLKASAWNSMADWSNPGTTVITGVDIVAFYLGGWTPHVWTASQISAQSVYWMLPIWVYNPNKPGSTQGNIDGKAAVAAMKNLGVATGTRIVVDMEGSVDQSYLSAFRLVIGPAGFHMGVYGGPSTVFNNWPQNSFGPGGGWWVADWTYTPFMYDHDGVWATQWTDNNATTSWDQSTTVDFSQLWWHKPVTFTLKATATAQSSVSKSSSFVVSS
jgi:hypothetical protein